MKVRKDRERKGATEGVQGEGNGKDKKGKVLVEW